MIDKISFPSFYTDYESSADMYSEYQSHDLLLELISNILPDSVSVESYCEYFTFRRYLPLTKQEQHYHTVVYKGYECDFDDGYLVRVTVDDECVIDFNKFLCSDRVIFLNRSIKFFRVINHQNVKLILYCAYWPKLEYSSYLTDITFEEIRANNMYLKYKLKTKSINSGYYNVCDSNLIERYLDHSPSTEPGEEHFKGIDSSKVYSLSIDLEEQLCNIGMYPNIKKIKFELHHKFFQDTKFPKLDEVYYDYTNRNKSGSLKLTELPEANHYKLDFDTFVKLRIDRPIKSLSISRIDFDVSKAKNTLKLFNDIKFDHFPTEKIAINGSVFIFKDKMKMPKSARN